MPIRLAHVIRQVLSVAVAIGVSAAAHAEVKPNGVFGDHMVIQRGKPIHVYGTAGTGEAVSVSLNGQSRQTTADASGQWRVELPAMDAGGPHLLQVGSRQFRDVMVGEVWLASGQSNMDLSLARVGQAEIPANDQIRYFRQEALAAMTPSDQARGQWRTAGPESASEFTAVGYYFAARLQKELGLTVGIVEASQGSTSIQQWMPLEAWAKFSSPDWVARFRSKAAEFDAAYARTIEELDKLDPQTLGRDYQKAHREVRRKYGPDLKSARLEIDGGLPCTMWNDHVAPFRHFGIRGWIWYQGEFDTGLYGSAKPAGYADRQRALVQAWREQWGEPAMPFYYVQLPNYGAEEKRSGESTDDNWAVLRNEQRLALDVPHTAMVITLDVGGALHPPMKQPVGERLASAALANTYGRPTVWSGPLPVSAVVEGELIRVRFEHAEGLADPTGGELEGFAVAPLQEATRKGAPALRPASAKIDGPDVLVSIPADMAPAWVYYACHQNPKVELVNKAGLPASPFILPVSKK